MPWQKLPGEAAKITVHPNKQISWNRAAHSILGDPKAVELFHNVEQNRLGFRRVSFNSSAAVVTLGGNFNYVIDADIQLDEAGVSVAEDWEAMPQEPAPPSPPGNQLGGEGIVWIELP